MQFRVNDAAKHRPWYVDTLLMLTAEQGLSHGLLAGHHFGCCCCPAGRLLTHVVARTSTAMAPTLTAHHPTCQMAPSQTGGLPPVSDKNGIFTTYCQSQLMRLYQLALCALVNADVQTIRACFCKHLCGFWPTDLLLPDVQMTHSDAFVPYLDLFAWAPGPL